MQVVDDFTGMVLTYTVGAWAFVQANQTSIVSALGFVLLVARLIHDVPKAYRTIRGWFKPDER